MVHKKKHTMRKKEERNSFRLVLSSRATSEINKTWNQLVQQQEQQKQDKKDEEEDDLVEFLRDGGSSNHRTMKWSILECGPSCQFKLHAHPNIELLYCIQGQLHEVRMKGDALSTTRSRTTSNSSSSSLLSNKEWYFSSLFEGQWLVNETGSVHKSFTSTSSGCRVWAMWSGSHADFDKDLSIVNNAVEEMNAKLCTDGCNPSLLLQTFVPESEQHHD
mmetsp:Transcript_37392/g.57386  ORF Transcript_37392/g.57386 Transcript_37392/m.57386 type:complete len:218 (-) Transcript_37392:339-992(-)